DREIILNKAAEEILGTLITQYQPEKVFLFGSLVTGDVQEWSDLDFAIIKDTSLSFLERSEQVALLCMAPVGVDYLVYTPAEWAEMVANQNPFIVEEVLGKGKLLYERESRAIFPKARARPCATPYPTPSAATPL
ncbi:MAG: nucleotidyltransferase domain-containing protein, partial [Anaerolineales bacterium]|nr:nucleotidyltransferase domain-containing protein [Anaerolineales bacterium]